MVENPCEIDSVEGSEEPSGLSELGWQALVGQIQSGKVVPVVSRDFIRLVPNSQDMEKWRPAKDGDLSPPREEWLSVESFLTLRLAEEWTMSGEQPAILPKDLPLHPRFNDFWCLYLDRKGPRGRLDDLYPLVNWIYKDRAKFVSEGEPPPGGARLPDLLTRFAALPQFRLFIATSGDSLLENAIRTANPERFGSGAAFSRANPQDLPAPLSDGQVRGVYHLFGRYSTSAGSFPFTEADLVDYTVALNTAAPSLKRLWDVLQNHHLLVLGGRLPDWLSRFFLRTAKPNLFTEGRQSIIADGFGGLSDDLPGFLSRFSPETRIVRGGGERFVEELIDRLKTHNDGAGGSASISTVPSLAPKMPRKAAFISYFNKDRQWAEQLWQRLDAKGVKAWYDRDQLEEGDNWDQKIRRNVAQCAVFCPLVSYRTEQTLKSYFRTEWKEAKAYYGRTFGSNLPFLFPLILDSGLAQSRLAQVPDEFKEAQMGHCDENGMIPESYVQRVADSVRQWEELEKEREEAG